MAVEDHPLYEEWSRKFDRAVQAELRYYKAVMSKPGPNVSNREAAKQDLLKARQDYAEVSDRLDVETERNIGDR